MRAKVNENCIGCGLCAGTCPDVFQMTDEGVARAQEGPVAPELEALVLELEDCVPAVPSAEEETEARELSRTIDRWLDGLPREDRVLFVRRYWYGQRLDELSGQLGWSPNRVSQRLLRLRTGLKRYLEREGVVL